MIFIRANVRYISQNKRKRFGSRNY